MNEGKKILNLLEDFKILRDPVSGIKRIKDKIRNLEQDTDYLKEWYEFSREDGDVYPDQGLLTTPHDYLNFQSRQMLPQEKILEALKIRFFLLEMSNHPYRIHFLRQVQNQKFMAPGKVD